jgi:hypothetical protein
VDKVNTSYYEEPPGVFIDGVLYTDYSQVARIPVSQISSISVLTEVYYYHDFIFGGIVDLHTTRSDFNAVQMLPGMTRLVFPLASRSEMHYHVVDHASDGSQDRIPDFRHLVCWEPDIVIGPAGEQMIRFYTGDVTGEHTIKVSGMTREGILVKAETRIVVEAD